MAHYLENKGFVVPIMAFILYILGGKWEKDCVKITKYSRCSARDWDGKDYLRIIPRVVW